MYIVEATVNDLVITHDRKRMFDHLDEAQKQYDALKGIGRDTIEHKCSVQNAYAKLHAAKCFLFVESISDDMHNNITIDRDRLVDQLASHGL